MNYMVQASGGDVYGPADMAMLVQWVREGRITAEMMVAEQGTSNWRRAGEYPELAAALAPSVPSDPMTGAPAVPGQTGMPNYYGQIPLKPVTNTMAVLSLVFGIIGLLMICPIILSVVAIVLSILAQGQIKRSNGMQTGAGIAIAGLVLGIIGIPLGCLMGILVTAMQNR